MTPSTLNQPHLPPPSFLINPHPKHVFREAIARLPMNGIHTICEEAKCPNRGECLPHHGTISIMVMGSICTRGCPFCAVTTGKPQPLDPAEPQKVVEIAGALKVRYLVMTSPNRDELADGGASQFVRIVAALREFNPELKIEILVPDFQGKEASFEALLKGPPDVIAHDLQTIPRLYGPIRPGAEYERSLNLFRWFRKKPIPPKSCLEGGPHGGLRGNRTGSDGGFIRCRGGRREILHHWAVPETARLQLGGGGICAFGPVPTLGRGGREARPFGSGLTPDPVQLHWLDRLAAEEQDLATDKAG